MNTHEKNTMDQEDALLTAYALGELPAAERAKVEARLKTDPAAAKQVETVRKLGTMIADDLKAEAAAAPATKLSPSQRARVEATGAKKPMHAAPAPQGLLVRFRLVAVAAGVLVVGGMTMTMTSKMSSADRAYGPTAAREIEAERMLADARAPRFAPTTEAAGMSNAPPIPAYDPTAELEEEVRPGRTEDLTREVAGRDLNRHDPASLDLKPEPTTAPTAQGAPLGDPARDAVDRMRVRDKDDAYGAGGAPGSKPDVTFGTPSRPVDPTLGRRTPTTTPPAPAPAPGDTSLRGRTTSTPPTATNEEARVVDRPTTPVNENEFKSPVGDDVRSTFSIDVDTASYSNVRRFLSHHQLPQPDAVRIEEMINYFNYDYAPPTGEDPFAAHVEVTGSPFTAGNRLVRIGLKGRELEGQRPPCNLVFLLDVSGSMNSPGRMPLVKEGLKALVEQLSERDRVSIVVYSGASGLVLPATSGDQKGEILDALNRLNANGSTNAGVGIELAYNTAISSFVEGGINRVILCTDGDFNVGIQDPTELESLIARKAKSGVFLTVLGYEVPSRGDARCEALADRGNGNYAVIDGAGEAKKVLVEQAAGTLVTIAKDVKIQVEWNPACVAGYRLLGYENRVMSNAAFRDDAKDAGEIGLGHTVTALYEVVPAKDAPRSEPLVTVRLRYKQPDGDTAKELAFPASDAGGSFDSASEDTRFAAAVAGFGMLLRGSRHAGRATWPLVSELAKGAITNDPGGRRAEMVRLIARASELSQ